MSGGSETGRGAEGVPVKRAREQLMRTRPDPWSGNATGRMSKALSGEPL